MTFEPADVYWINDTGSLEVLADPTRLEILELCMVPRSVKEIAELMGVPRTRLYHHVGLLEEAGIISVADTRPAGAMVEKIYQASAMSYQPSDDFAKNAAPRELADAIMTSLLGATRADFVRAVDEGLFALIDRNSGRRVSLGRRLMRLTPDRLQAFIDDLEGLFEKYRDHDEGDDVLTVGLLHVVHPSSRRVP